METLPASGLPCLDTSLRPVVRCVLNSGTTPSAKYSLGLDSGPADHSERAFPGQQEATFAGLGGTVTEECASSVSVWLGQRVGTLLGCSLRFCTIVCRNYLAVARVLASSLKEHTAGDLTALVSDDPEHQLDAAAEEFRVLRPDNLNLDQRNFLDAIRSGCSGA